MRKNSRRNPREKKKIEDDSTWEPPWPQRDFPCMGLPWWGPLGVVAKTSDFFLYFLLKI